MPQIPTARHSSSMACSMFVRVLMVGCAFLRTGVVEVSGQDEALDERCTHLALSACYNQYTHVFWNNKLRPDHDGHLNLTAFYEVCRDFSKPSSCQADIVACPQIPASNFPLQEKGYQALRDFVCNIEAFQDLQRALQCIDIEKSTQCTAGPPPEQEEPPYDPDGPYCRFAIKGWTCSENAILPDCTISADKAKTAFSTAREAERLLRGCGVQKSAASPLKSLGLLLGVVTLPVLRLIHA